ncbi:MAG: hypothetical protein AB8C84_07620 [Oligoflexales bacterium]
MSRPKGGHVHLGQQRTAVKISVGEAYVCAKLDTNQIKCWGDGSDGQLGHGDNINLGDKSSEMGDNLPIIDL